MATKKSAKDEALEDIKKMDEGSAEKKASTKASTKTPRPKPKVSAKEAAQAEDPKEKEEVKVGDKDTLDGEEVTLLHKGKLVEKDGVFVPEADLPLEPLPPRTVEVA